MKSRSSPLADVPDCLKVCAEDRRGYRGTDDAVALVIIASLRTKLPCVDRSTTALRYNPILARLVLGDQAMLLKGIAE